MAENPLPNPAPQQSRAFGRSKCDFPNLSAAEKALIASCGKGWGYVIGGGTLPEEATLQNTIRAELIRFLVLGGDDANPVHEEGVMICGAWIKGKLNLHQAKADKCLYLKKCNFENAPVLLATNLPELVLGGSCMPGLLADRMKVTGNVCLNDGFSALGEVRLLGAQIGGNLDCSNGSFNSEGGKALSADGVTVAGDVFLCDGFTALGEVRLLGAQIGGDLSCHNGRFSNEGERPLNADGMKVAGSVFLRDGFTALGEVRLLGAKIGGNLECSEGSFSNERGRALSADGMAVAGGVFLRDGFSALGEVRLIGAQIGRNLDCKGGSLSHQGERALNADGMKVAGGLLLEKATISGAIDLTAAKVGTLADDGGCWKAGGHRLDGFAYDRIVGSNPAKRRVEWLQTQHSQHLDADFAPQPWEQLAKVLRDMGHPAEAAQVAIAKQDQWRKATADSKRNWGEWVHRVLHFFYGWLAGYGHRPIWTVDWMAGVCVLFSLVFWWGGHAGYFGPTNPVIHASAQFETCGAPGEANKAFWTSAECPTPPEYTTFQPFFYSLDLILPLVDLHQEADWAPLVVNPAGSLWPGRILRWMMWFEILFGWVASLTLVAVLGRLVDKD